MSNYLRVVTQKCVLNLEINISRVYFYLGNYLPEVLKIASTDVRSWLESETFPIFSPVHAKAEKLLDDMRKALEETINFSKILLESSRKEIEKKNRKTFGRAKALNKLARLFLERIRQIDIPNEVSYNSFHEFAQETGKAFAVTEVDVRKWFPKISPFFIRDRRKFITVFEKAKDALEEIHRFLTKEYIKTKTLEDTFQLIDRLLAVEKQLADLEARKKKTEAEKASFDKRIAETRQEIASLRSREGVSRLGQTTSEVKELSVKVKHRLRHLRKPFIKFRSLATRGGGSGLTPEELEKLNKYVETSFEAFAMEETDYPLLKSILRKLDFALSEGKLKLKADRKRKAERDMNEILNKNSLNALHQRCRNVLMRKRKLSTSTEVKETEEDMLRLQKKLKRLKRRRKLFELRGSTTERKFEETVETIQKQKNEIEKNVLDFTGKNVQIEQKSG
jgi:predicted  nucleic acid-binding Zn-ribbon protein